MSDYEAYEAGKCKLFVGTAETTVGNAEPGFLITLDGLYPIFKTEYQDQDANGEYRPICYNQAGERWHGDYNTKCVEVLIQ